MWTLLTLFLFLVPCFHAIDFKQQGPSPLDFFIEHRQYQSIQQLIEKGADLDLPNQDGWTPLMVAIYYKDEGASQLLIEGGADIEKEIEGGGLPLHYALQNDLEETVRLLIQKGVDVNKQSSAGFSPLMVSLFASSADTVSVLLEETKKRQTKYAKWGYCKKLTSPSRRVKCQVIDTNLTDLDGKTAIFYGLSAALAEGSLSTVQKVTESYPTIDPISTSFMDKLNQTLSHHYYYLNMSTQEEREEEEEEGYDAVSKDRLSSQWKQTQVQLNMDQTTKPHISPLLMILSQLFDDLVARTLYLPSQFTPSLSYRPSSIDALYQVYTRYHEEKHGRRMSDTLQQEKEGESKPLSEEEKTFALFWEEQEEALLREKYIPLLSLLLDHGLNPYFKNTDGIDGYAYCQSKLLKATFTFLFHHPSQKELNQQEENRIREEHPNGFVYSMTPKPIPSHHDEL